MSIDINCDVGEGYGIYNFGQDDKIIGLVTSANIACGFHAGDYNQMFKTINICLENNAAIGAHPGYPDLMGFGRRNIDYSGLEITNMITYQVGALMAIAGSLGTRVEYIKPHGALYNLAAIDTDVAGAVIDASVGLGNMPLVGPPDSVISRLAGERGIVFIREGFADRNYNDDGTLVSRDDSNAVINDPAVAAQRVLIMVKEKTVISVRGRKTPLCVDTVCVHGDNQNAPEIIRGIRKVLKENGIKLMTISQMNR